MSLLSLGTLAAFERDVAVPRLLLRFRANIYVSGAEPWAEFGCLGRTLRAGSTTLLVRRRTPRCPAVQVNPETAVRDADPLRELRSAYGHADLGVYAEVMEGGALSEGDALRLGDPVA